VDLPPWYRVLTSTFDEKKNRASAITTTHLAKRMQAQSYDLVVIGGAMLKRDGWSWTTAHICQHGLFRDERSQPMFSRS
jgi:hypothetical protein